VIRSRDGWVWHDMCTTDPDSAEEIAEALQAVEEAR
jgi:3-hydroxyisobutyrate dehydrogenase-like beta-hydroxyacid dehydrogenase